MDFELEKHDNYFIVVKDSTAATGKRIGEIVSSANFCPFSLQISIKKNYAFSIVPFAIPSFFNEPILPKQERKVLGIDKQKRPIGVNSGVKTREGVTYKTKLEYWANDPGWSDNISYLVRQFAFRNPPGTARWILGCGYFQHPFICCAKGGLS